MYAPNRYTDTYDENGELVPGSWRDEVPEDMREVFPFENDREPDIGMRMRDTLANYFCSEYGEVDFQFNVNQPPPFPESLE